MKLIEVYQWQFLSRNLYNDSKLSASSLAWRKAGAAAPARAAELGEAPRGRRALQGQQPRLRGSPPAPGSPLPGKGVQAGGLGVAWLRRVQGGWAGYRQGARFLS